MFMVSVRLENAWTDPAGIEHPSGATVEVDAATLAELEASGVVAAPDAGVAPDTDPGVTEAATPGAEVFDIRRTPDKYIGPSLSQPTRNQPAS
jgi:hypothetical protein